MKDCRRSRQPANLDPEIVAPERCRRRRPAVTRTFCKRWNARVSILPITEVLVVADCWQTEPDAEAVIQRAIAAAAEIADADVGEAELAVMLTDDAGIRTLNSNWRGIDKPTNVLSFPALQPTGAAQPGDAPRMLGDIAIAYRDHAQGGRRRTKAVRSSSQPSCGARLPASDRLRSRKRRRRRGHGSARDARFWRSSAFPIPMRTGSGWTEMPDSEPTHDNPRNTRNLPAVVQQGEVAAPGRRQLADARDPHAVRLEGGIGPRRSAGRARRLARRTRSAFPPSSAPCCATSSACTSGASPT